MVVVSTVLGIPGTLCSPALFEPTWEALRASHPDAVAGLSLRSVSWMDGPGPWDIPSVAARLASSLRAASAGGTAHGAVQGAVHGAAGGTASGAGPALVVGHSTGGAIALELALSAPDLVSGLVLVDTGPNMHDHGDVDGILRTIRDDWGEPLWAGILDRSFASPLPADVRSSFLDYASGVPRQAALDVLTSQRALDYLPRLESLECPVAVVHGRLDPVRTVAQATAFAAALAAAATPVGPLAGLAAAAAAGPPAAAALAAAATPAAPPAALAAAAAGPPAAALAGAATGATAASPRPALTLLDCGHSPPYERPAELAAALAPFLL